MNFSLTRNTKAPSRGHLEDAGIDIYVPQFQLQFLDAIYTQNNPRSFCFDMARKLLIIYPHERIKLPTGVYFNIPAGNMLLVLEKTSVPNKTGIISGARVIDASYRGEFIASLINTSDQNAYLEQGQKFIQLVLVPINSDYELNELDHSQLYLGEPESVRNSGAFGSTGLF